MKYALSVVCVAFCLVSFSCDFSVNHLRTSKKFVREIQLLSQDVFQVVEYKMLEEGFDDQVVIIKVSTESMDEAVAVLVAKYKLIRVPSESYGDIVPYLKEVERCGLWPYDKSDLSECWMDGGDSSSISTTIYVNRGSHSIVITRSWQ